MIELKLIDIGGEVGAILPPELLADLGIDKSVSSVVLERGADGYLTIRPLLDAPAIPITI